MVDNISSHHTNIIEEPNRNGLSLKSFYVTDRKTQFNLKPSSYAHLMFSHLSIMSSLTSLCDLSNKIQGYNE